MVKKEDFCLIAQRYEEAIGAYDKALELNPHDPRAKEGRQRALDELNKEEH